MRRSKPLMMLAVSAAIGLAATFAAAKYLKAGGTSAEPETRKPTKQYVVVSTKKIPEGKEIVATDVKQEEKPIGELPEDAIGKVELVVGRKTMFSITKGEVLCETKLEAKRLVLAPRPGMRKISLYKADVPAGIQPGMHVDLISVVADGKDSDADGGILLEYVRVLDVPLPDKRTRNAPKATLEVSPAGAVKLVRAMNKGSLTLIINCDKEAPKPHKRVAVAAADIAQGQTLGAEDLKMMNVPADELPTGRLVTDPGSVSGMQACRGISEGAVVLASYLRQPIVKEAPDPSKVLAQAQAAHRAGNTAKAEALLKDVLALQEDGEAAGRARELLKTIGEERVRNAAMDQFKTSYAGIKTLVADGEFEKAIESIQSGTETFDGLETDDGAAADLLKLQQDLAVKGLKRARQLCSMYINLKTNGREGPAAGLLKQLTALCPKGRFLREARAGKMSPRSEIEKSVLSGAFDQEEAGPKPDAETKTTQEK